MAFVLAIIALILVAWFAWRNRDVRDCRWRADRSRDREGESFFRCVACGAEVHTATGRPPEVCHRPG